MYDITYPNMKLFKFFIDILLRDMDKVYKPQA